MLPTAMPRLSHNGEPVYHFTGISCFARYAVTSPKSLIKIDVGAAFGCAISTGTGFVFGAAMVRPGQSAALSGHGRTCTVTAHSAAFLRPWVICKSEVGRKTPELTHTCLLLLT